MPVQVELEGSCQNTNKIAKNISITNRITAPPTIKISAGKIRLNGSLLLLSRCPNKSLQNADQALLTNYKLIQKNQSACSIKYCRPRSVISRVQKKCQIFIQSKLCLDLQFKTSYISRSRNAR